MKDYRQCLGYNYFVLEILFFNGLFYFFLAFCYKNLWQHNEALKVCPRLQHTFVHLLHSLIYFIVDVKFMIGADLTALYVHFINMLTHWVDVEHFSEFTMHMESRGPSRRQPPAGYVPAGREHYEGSMSDSGISSTITDRKMNRMKMGSREYGGSNSQLNG